MILLLKLIQSIMFFLCLSLSLSVPVSVSLSLCLSLSLPPPHRHQAIMSVCVTIYMYIIKWLWTVVRCIYNDIEVDRLALLPRQLYCPSRPSAVKPKRSRKRGCCRGISSDRTWKMEVPSPNVHFNAILGSKTPKNFYVDYPQDNMLMFESFTMDQFITRRRQPAAVL